jgi:23S rRNA (adenine2503-C2)-methyltransferase
LLHPPNHIFEHTPETLAQWCTQHQMPVFRAKQVLEWVYEKGVADPAQMSNLSKLDRDRLAREITFLSGRTLMHQRATDGVQKLLIEWDDFAAPAAPLQPTAPLPLALSPVHHPDAGHADRQTECVMIPSLGVSARRPTREPEEADDGFETVDTDEEQSSRRSQSYRAAPPRPSAPRFTACISSQVGCPVGCKFCASGLGGLDSNLSAGRIVEQVWRLGRLEGVRRITNVVFMGMGEPLSNLQAVVPAIRTITALWGLGISARKITISTVGLPKAIDKLSQQLDLPVTLALSLHAPNDELRRQLIPWAEYTTIKDLLAACQRWFEKTGREITLEYTLLRGVNDRAEHAEQLAQVARTLRANVNLIRYNEVQGLPFQRPQTDDVRMFQDVLRGRHINAHIRASRGRDIAAACGQLRHEASGAAR